MKRITLTTLFATMIFGFTFSALAIEKDSLVLFCPTGNTNTSIAGGVTYNFIGFTPDGKQVKTPGYFRLCTSNDHNCKMPEIVNGALHCYYVPPNNVVADPWTFRATSAFKPNQKAKAIDMGAQFLQAK